MLQRKLAFYTGSPYFGSESGWGEASGSVKIGKPLTTDHTKHLLGKFWWGRCRWACPHNQQHKRANQTQQTINAGGYRHIVSVFVHQQGDPELNKTLSLSNPVHSSPKALMYWELRGPCWHTGQPISPALITASQEPALPAGLRPVLCESNMAARASWLVACGYAASLIWEQRRWPSAPQEGRKEGMGGGGRGGRGEGEREEERERERERRERERERERERHRGE